MGRLTDLLKAQLAAPQEPGKAKAAIVCAYCKSEGIPSYARRTGLWMIVHFGGCPRETLVGDSREDVADQWKEQNG